MHFWIREAAGWLLILLGIFVFYLCLSALLSVDRSYFLEAGPMTVIGFVLFRGGLHLVKVATAARICLHVHKELQRTAKQRSSEG